jgi:chromosomal replication initiator protein
MTEDHICPRCGSTAIEVGHARRLIERVALFCRVSLAQVYGQQRTRQAVIARHVAIYVVARECGLKATTIARLFGRDHSTVGHAIQKVEESGYLKSLADGVLKAA